MAITTEPTTEAATEPPADAPLDTVRSLFRYSTWLHVGTDAETCEDAETGNCSNPLHFHAWCRLPNQFQHREIREKALAAKARKVRQMRNPDSDAAAILEEDLDALARIGDSVREDLINELISDEWWADYLEAVEDVKAQPDPDAKEDGVLLWEHIAADQERFKELKALPEDERPKDEFDELNERLTRYHAAIEAAAEEIRKPKRDALADKDINALIDLTRDRRIDDSATEEFAHTYSIWEWVACTRRTPNGAALWTEPLQLRDISGDVLDGLKTTYDDLEKTQREAASQGNS